MTDLLQALIVWLIENTMPVFDASWLDQLSGVGEYLGWIPLFIDTEYWAEIIYDWLIPIELALDFPMLVFWFAGKATFT